MAKNRKKLKAIKPLGCAVMASVCALSAINVMSFSAFAAGSEYEGYTYKLETTSRQDSLNKANKFNETIAEEGFTLLHNKDKALPLASTVKKVNLFGKNWSNPAFGGGGSSSFSTSSGDGIDGYKSMKDAGFEFNPTLKAFYDDDTASGPKRPQYQYQAADMITAETPQAKYTDAVKNSLAAYNQASIVMVSRTGGEGIDVSDFFFGTSVEGRSTLEGAHYLQLDDNEKALIDFAKETSADKKVILVINAAQPLELDAATLAKVDAVLWVGLPGSTGFAALGRILKGEVNPSGRTVDTYAKNFSEMPSVQNFGLNKQAAVRDGTGSSAPIKVPAGNALLDAAGKGAGAEVVYEEGIYVGYKYYETRAFEEDNKAGATANKWWTDNVLYPFGYGLSYTTFEYTSIAFNVPDTLDKDSEITVSVTVKNNGEVAGKEVVQLYYSAPYTAGKIEKAHVNLGDFVKTSLLQPGASETVTMKISLESMASYDWDDANGNKFKGYELDAGDYTLFVSRDAHSWYNAPETSKKTFNLADGIKYEMNVDNKTYGAEDVHSDNQFDDMSAGIMGRGIDEMSRENFEETFPQKPTEEDRTVDAAFVAKLKYGVTSKEDPSGAKYDEGQPWYSATKPTQRKTALTEEDEGVIRLMSLKGIDPYNADGTENAQWKKFLDQFTPQQLMDFVENGKFKSEKFDVLGIPEGIHPDGPFGFVGQINGYGSARCYYVSPCIVAATFNKELVEQQGEHIGEEGAWMGYNGLYGPGVNIHRTPFSGRNFEYYSEDGFLSGMMAACVTKGMQSKGVFPFLKHFALNDQETDRNGTTTWATEQAAREIYLKAFQLAIDVNSTDLFDDETYVGHDGALGIMSSFNRVGTTWAGASYPLLTNVLRKEWGFKGIVVTDWYNGGYMDQEQMVRAGNDLSLGTGKNITKAYKAYGDTMLTATLLTSLRKAALNLSYVALQTCNMGKLTNYQDYVSSKYMAFQGAELKIDFSNSVFASEYPGLTYVVTPADHKSSHATRPVDLAEQLPDEFISMNETTGMATINIEGEEAKEYQLNVSIKTSDGKYIGQSATVFINYTGATLEASLAEISDKVDTLKSELATANDNIKTLTDRITELEKESATKDELAAVQAELEEVREAAEAMRAELQGKIDELTATVTALSEKHAEEIKALQDKIAELEEKTAGGCGGSISLGTTLILSVGALLMATAFVLIRKSRKSDK